MNDLAPEQLHDAFPMSSYRPGQKNAIRKILEAFASGNRFVLLEAPTGSGKSAIAFTIAQILSPVFCIVPQKFLQDQYMQDFGENGRHVGNRYPMIDIKGRGNYPCNFYERVIDTDGFDKLETSTQKRYRSLVSQDVRCDRGECKREGVSKLGFCVGEDGTHCPYFVRLYQAAASKICLMNFHSFLFQTSITHFFGKRTLLIIDECHNTEDVLMKFVELKISDKHFLKQGIKFPEFDNVAAYLEYFQEIDLASKVASLLYAARITGNTKEEDEWESVLLKLSIINNINHDTWISEWTETDSGTTRTVTLKPLFVDEFAQRYIFSMADYVLMMSATVLSKTTMCEALGLDKDTTKMFRMPSCFPPEIRPIYYRPAGSMSYNNKATTIPKLIKAVDTICTEHSADRGIIHTHNFEIANELLEKCTGSVRSRFLFQNQAEFGGNKRALLDKHTEANNSIIIAPAMHEGLDLKDDLGRFQIICKVPYPSMADPQIAARMKISQDYYNWRTATKLVQSYGRIYRHAADHGKTYVLDKDFKNFVSDVEHMLPSWFTEVIRWAE
jgi:Rad3-related DNA helicase